VEGVFSVDPAESALEAGLRYVSGCGPCIQRIRRGKSFRYTGTDGKPLKDPKHLERIRSLVIPPAWENVWICPSPNGHVQAIGWDARGRKQYRYHPKYREVRDQAKFSRMLAFGAVLALIRKRVAEDLARRGLPKEKVLATVVRLLETTFIRVGNDEYARENESFGLTTMRNRHVRIEGSRLTFHFRGKSGQDHTIELTDRRLARVVRECQDLPGYELFEYVDESGQVSRVDSSDVNAYIREITGQDFTAKDFRTWAGTIIAATELNSCERAGSATEAKRITAAAVKRVAHRLGNRPATCRKYYIHPAILEAYATGDLFARMQQGEQQNTAYAGLGLRPEEYCVMVLIADYQLAAAA
jgi:DNA topoisomerase-1